MVAVTEQVPVPLVMVSRPPAVTAQAVDAPALKVTAPVPLPPDVPSWTAASPNVTVAGPLAMSAACAACPITSVPSARAS